MQVTVGTILVVLSWAIACGAVVVMGMPFAQLTGTANSRFSLVRGSLWWGLAVAFAIFLTLTLLTPMHGSTTSIVFIVAVVLLGIVGLRLRRRVSYPAIADESRAGHRLLVWLPVLVLAALVLYLAARALGPANNYDTGLYHLGAINYAADFSAIPGIANIFNPLGYSNSMFPFAAILGNGPWGGNGFRLANGLIITLAALDLALRLIERRFSWGTYVLLLGVGTMWLHLVAISDFWVTSPTSDTAVMVLCLIATAYLADALDSSTSLSHRSSAGLLSILACVLLLSMRPTMVVFAGALVIIILIRWIRGRVAVSAPERWGLATVGALAGVIGAVQLVRDFVLSGWLLYPLQVHGFDVAWRATDPWMLRTATLGAARDPEDLWNAAAGWGWIPVWFSNLRTQWETYLFVLLVGAAVLVYVIARLITGRWAAGRLMLLAVTPSALALIAWFLASPPSFRFIWGPLFTLPIILLAGALQSIAAHSASHSSSTINWSRLIPSTLVIVVCGVLVVTMGYSLAKRQALPEGGQENHWKLGFIDLTYSTTPITVTQTSPRTLPTGLTVTMVEGSEQCWDAFPLCVPRIEDTVRGLGPSIQDGFAR